MPPNIFPNKPISNVVLYRKIYPFVVLFCLFGFAISYGDGTTGFHEKQMTKVDSNYICLIVILNDFSNISKKKKRD